METCLVIVKPDREEEILCFSKPTELTVGRSSACNCCLDFDPMVSRMHAVLLIEPPLVRVRDLNSTNGLIVNGVLYGGADGETTGQILELRNGDEVIVGSTVFRVELHTPAGRLPLKTSLPASGELEAGRTRVMKKVKVQETGANGEDTVARENPFLPKNKEA